MSADVESNLRKAFSRYCRAALSCCETELLRRILEEPCIVLLLWEKSLELVGSRAKNGGGGKSGDGETGFRWRNRKTGAKT